MQYNSVQLLKMAAIANCGIVDPDCSKQGQSVIGCGTDYSCNATTGLCYSRKLQIFITIFEL